MAGVSSGTYRHYKGNLYTVIDIATHTETGEEMVVYRAQYEPYSLWVRPRIMFEEMVMVDGIEIPRFRREDEDGSAAE